VQSPGIYLCAEGAIRFNRQGPPTEAALLVYLAENASTVR